MTLLIRKNCLQKFRDFSSCIGKYCDGDNLNGAVYKYRYASIPYVQPVVKGRMPPPIELNHLLFEISHIVSSEFVPSSLGLYKDLAVNSGE